jgi:hypothetical protein
MAEDADRTAFIQAAIRELQLQRERGGLSTPLHRSDRDAFDALGFDMPVVRPEDAWELSRTLAAAAAAAVSGGRSAASLPPWFKVTKRFVSGVVYCAERHVGQLPVSAAAATACEKPGLLLVGCPYSTHIIAANSGECNLLGLLRHGAQQHQRPTEALLEHVAAVLAVGAQDCRDFQPQLAHGAVRRRCLPHCDHHVEHTHVESPESDVFIEHEVP